MPDTTESLADDPPSLVGRRLLEACATALGTASDRLDEYAALLAALAVPLASDDASTAGNDGDATFRAWLEGQRARVERLTSMLEDTVLDGFLRIADRNVRIKHYEDGEFV